MGSKPDIEALYSSLLSGIIAVGYRPTAAIGASTGGYTDRRTAIPQGDSGSSIIILEEREFLLNSVSNVARYLGQVFDAQDALAESSPRSLLSRSVTGRAATFATDFARMSRENPKSEATCKPPRPSLTPRRYSLTRRSWNARYRSGLALWNSSLSAPSCATITSVFHRAPLRY